MSHKLLCCFLIFSLVATTAHSLQCYFCSPQSGVSCSDPQKTPCAGSCGKEMLRGMTAKGCYQLNGIDTYHENGCFTGPNGEWFCTCNSNLCNSSMRSLVFSFGTLVALSLFAYLV